MRAIVIKQHGGPEVLAIEQRPDPTLTPDQVLIDVKAFGLNHAEVYFRSGAWGEVAEITSIECVGAVRDDPGKQFRPGQKVAAIVGGLGRTLNGSYAERVAVPRSNVVAFESNLPWETLAAIPESYATAWTALIGILKVDAGDTVLIRGATSALGQAAVNIAAALGARVIATTRKEERAPLLLKIGAHEVLIESPKLSNRVHASHSKGSMPYSISSATRPFSIRSLRCGGAGRCARSASSAGADR